MASIENRLSSLEEDRRHRDKHDDEVLAVMKKIQGDVHTLAMRVEKKLSFISGVAFSFSLIGGALGTVVVVSLKKIGIMA